APADAANTFESPIGPDGTIIARPRDGLVAYRIPGGAHVHWLARGLAADNWTGRRLTYPVWPRHSRAYHLALAVSRSTAARTVEIAAGTSHLQTVTVAVGAPLRVTIAGPGPLRMYVHVPPGPVGARVFGVRVVSLRYVAAN